VWCERLFRRWNLRSAELDVESVAEYADYDDDSVCGDAAYRIFQAMIVLDTFAVEASNQASMHSASVSEGIEHSILAFSYAEIAKSISDTANTIWSAMCVVNIIATNINPQRKVYEQVMRPVQIKVCLPSFWKIHEELAMVIFSPDKIREFLGDDEDVEKDLSEYME